MEFVRKVIERETKISVVGLGYVGLPIAVEFSKYVDVIGFDVNVSKITKLNGGIDPTDEIGNICFKDLNILFTSDEQHLKNSRFHIVAVPTPINNDRTPDLSIIREASKIIGRNLMKDSIVVYESTVYPGVTEEVCVPILEKESNLKCGVDFKVGYSPERINPSDKVHTLTNIKKIVSGMDEETLDVIDRVYGLVIKAGTFRATSIKVAEAAKVMENSQRDINIAFMNELSIIFHKLNIDMKDVLDAAKTKWNFLDFRPGLVGGHCIGVDPYYLTYKAEQIGYHPDVILSGRRINDGMGKYIAEITIKKIILKKNYIKNEKIGILGFTFKENCKDTRNTKVLDIIHELNDYGINPIVYDPIADKEEVKQLYSVDLVDLEHFKNLDALIIAVNHNEFMDLEIMDIDNMFMTDKCKVLIDVKGIMDKNEFIKSNYTYWRL